MSAQSPTSPSRPGVAHRHDTAPPVMALNGHFASAAGDKASSYEHGIQVVDEDKQFNNAVQKYLAAKKISPAGFNYHLVSVFGSQSTGKSTLLNHLFGTSFGVMSEQERRQTTKGIWMSSNMNQGEAKMADNILIMDVEGTDGRERGEDQDFERKSALFALATSEVLIVNIWEHQVGLYQGANMALLKTVFEVNLQLFLKDQSSKIRSLLFFVIRDHLGTTPVQNLKNTLLQDMSRIWSGISKPKGLENSKIDDYFDFSFAALPHKILQPDKFVSEVAKLGGRFKEGYKDAKQEAFSGNHEVERGVFLPEYHRRVPADGFGIYAESVWDQIVNNKDLDLPTQQELLAQFRCDEISREVLIAFDEKISPLEAQQADGAKSGNPTVLQSLGKIILASRGATVKDFETEASRYHKGVYTRKRAELLAKMDGRLKALCLGQLTAAHSVGVAEFTEVVTSAVRAGQKKGSGGSYDFADIVSRARTDALSKFKVQVTSLLIEGAAWSDFTQQLTLYDKDLSAVGARLRGEEMRRLNARVERWVKSQLGDSVGLEFNKLGSGRGGSRAPESGEQPTEKSLWNRVWAVFVDTVKTAESRFTERAKGLDASPEEVDVGRWHLRRKSWLQLKARIDEEVMEGNILLKLRENFEDKFRYDEEGVPRIWRPTDDIESIYTRARESTLTLIPLLALFSFDTGSLPPLASFIGEQPKDAVDEEDALPIGGVDDDEGKSLRDELTILNEAKRVDLTVRFKKTADGVYVEAKRSAIGGISQVPFYFYVLLLVLGWNELWAVLRNPMLFVLLLLLAGGAYVTNSLNLWGPMFRMANAASQQALEVGKERLREFLEHPAAGQQQRPVPADNISMDTLDSRGKKTVEEDDEI